MDFSGAYSLNEALGEDLRDKLHHIAKNARHVLAGQDEQLGHARHEADVIFRLQEAANSRAPGDSVNLLHMTRAAHRFSAELEGTDIREAAKITRNKLKIAAERESFSAKNHFNHRRKVGESSNEVASNHLAKTILHHSQSDGDLLHRELSRDVNAESNNDTYINRKPSLEPMFSSVCTRPKSSQNKGYLKETMSSSSQKGRRPMTAIEHRPSDLKYDDLLPPRSQSANRSRSRRQLELLSRLQPKEPEITLDDDGRPNWGAVLEARRRRRLQDLKAEEERIQNRVHNFISETERFNRRCRSAHH